MSILHKQITLSAIVAMSVSIMAQGQSKGATELKSEKDSLSYVIGTDVGEQLKDLNADIELEPFEEGFQDALEGKTSRIDSTKAENIRQRFAEDIRDELEKEQEEIIRQSKKEAEQFLKENKKRKEVKTTSSGLQYEVLEEGKGPKAQPGDTVEVIYTGMLRDSTVFDQSPEGQASVFPLEQIIPGLQEGILLMKEGARYRFYVPPKLAYGEEGAPPIIPANAVLIFELELVNTDVPPEKVSKR